MTGKKNWSGYVTKHSFALDLEEGVFTWGDPVKIAASLRSYFKTCLSGSVLSGFAELTASQFKGF